MTHYRKLFFENNRKWNTSDKQSHILKMSKMLKAFALRFVPILLVPKTEVLIELN